MSCYRPGNRRVIFLLIISKYTKDKSNDKSSRYYVYDERENNLNVLDIDSNGNLSNETYYDFKKLTPDTSARRFNIRGGVDTTPAGTINNINDISDNVNLFC